jgi:hypothetical protein
MKTITICICNSDNKLTQKDWSDFCSVTDSVVKHFCSELYFVGFSNPAEKLQNASWVFSLKEESILKLQKRISEVRKAYLQDSVAFVTGKSELI